MKQKDLVRISVATALIAIGAFLKIPSPVAGYFTLQLPVVILVAVILGSRNAAIAGFIYMFGGLIGIPWFAAGGGLSYIVRPTFGFIIAFIPAAYIAGKRLGKNNYIMPLLATIFVWVYGMIHYTFVVRLTSGTDVSYISAVIGILSPDFYVDMLLTLLFTHIGKRISVAIGGRT